MAPRGSAGECVDLLDTLAWLVEAGRARYVVTDAETDGLLSGPNLGLLRAVWVAAVRPVVASGGVATQVGTAYGADSPSPRRFDAPGR